MFSSALIQHIESEIRQTSSRILPMEVAGETLIIKCQEAARPLFGYTVLNALAKIFSRHGCAISPRSENHGDVT